MFTWSLTDTSDELPILHHSLRQINPFGGKSTAFGSFYLWSSSDCLYRNRYTFIYSFPEGSLTSTTTEGLTNFPCVHPTQCCVGVGDPLYSKGNTMRSTDCVLWWRRDTLHVGVTVRPLAAEWSIFCSINLPLLSFPQEERTPELWRPCFPNIYRGWAERPRCGLWGTRRLSS